MTKKNQYRAPALEKGLDILEYLSLKASPLSQTEIANGMDKNTNEIYRMLISLEERGYLIRDEVSSKYRLSLKLYHLSHRHSPIDEIRKVARNPMQQLSKTIQQSCHLGTIYHDQLLVVYQSKSPGPISLSIEEGALFPLAMTTSGRLLLAYMAEFEREELLEQTDITKEYPPEKQREILQLFNTIRDKGFYSATSEVTEGVTDIAVPLENINGGMPVSLTVSMLTNHLGKMTTIEEIVDETQKTSQNILRHLGY